MARKRRNHIPAWRKIVLACCFGYFIAVWVLPVFMLPFVNVLPYVHHSDLFQRLSISAACSVFVMCTAHAVSPWRSFATSYWSATFSGGLLNKTKELSLVLAGLAMFTYFSAELSPNFLGAMTHVLPANAYEETVEVEKV